MGMSIFSQYISFILERQDQILELTTQHLYLTFVAVFFAVLVAVPLGITITRFEKTAGIVIGIANTVQALPSLALLGFLIPILGIGSKPSIVMIFLYSLLPIIKNTYTGLANVDRAILEAGRGMGMTNWQLMKMVQLPLALPVIMAGIRISAVTAVGLTTIAALIGAGGLGQLIYRGISMVNNRMIIAGAVPAMVLTLVIDFLLNILEKLVTPKGIRRKAKK